eukprot:2758925-Rhodomonas_salina.1
MLANGNERGKQPSYAADRKFRAVSAVLSLAVCSGCFRTQPDGHSLAPTSARCRATSIAFSLTCSASDGVREKIGSGRGHTSQDSSLTRIERTRANCKLWASTFTNLSRSCVRVASPSQVCKSLMQCARAVLARSLWCFSKYESVLEAADACDKFILAMFDMGCCVGAVVACRGGGGAGEARTK